MANKSTLHHSAAMMDLTSAYRNAMSLEPDRPSTPAPEQFLTPFFLIGRHARPDFLQQLLQANTNATVHPARIHGYRAVALHEDVLVMLPTTSNDDAIDGVAYFPANQHQVRTLMSLTGGSRNMVTRPVSLVVWQGWRRRDMLGRAIVYVGTEEALRAEILEREEESRAKHLKEATEYCRRKVEGKVLEWLRGVEDGEGPVWWEWRGDGVEWDLKDGVVTWDWVDSGVVWGEAGFDDEWKQFAQK